MMARGEIVIDEEQCKGCGYCVLMCKPECIEMTDRFTAKGYFLPGFVKPENCTACGVCSWMCPAFAIEVYKILEEC